MRVFASYLLAAVLCAAPPARFAEHTVGTGLTGGYQVVAADVNHNGKTDLIGLASGMTELVWFENPGWQRHVIASHLSEMINLAAWDVDGDGIPEIVLASGFSMFAHQSTGIISLLHHEGDPRQPWSIREIARLPASHRLRWADIDDSGQKVLIDQPLTGADASSPQDHTHTPLVYFRPGEWKPRVISREDQGVVHGLYIMDWDGRGRDAILTGSFTGIHLYRLGRNGRWSHTEIAKGDPAPWPKCGASDVAVGRLGKRRFLATIEPWHGNEVVIYRQEAGHWRRHVIDNSIADGHTVLTVDLNGDGWDEVVVGYRAHGVNIYYARDRQAAQWSKTVLDRTMPAAGCAIADLNGDGRPDIACIGTATATLKWYENLGP